MNYKLIILILIMAILISFGTYKLLTNEKDIREALQYIKTNYGTPIAQKVEKIYRAETAHFKSKQFKNTGSPGMEAHSNNYPFGWTSLLMFWNTNPDKKPVGIYQMKESTGVENKEGISKKFLKFSSVKNGMEALANYLLIYPAERWYSTQPEAQQKYLTLLDSIKLHYT